MTSRITFYNKAGQYLTEVNATFKREYKLNEFGSGSFTLSTGDEKCREDYLQFGNYVLVEHDKLPVWAGMIDTPRIWGHGSVTVTVYSAEYILTGMVTDRTLNVSGSFGVIFQKMIEQMFNGNNFVADNIIRVGQIYGGGPTVSRVYNWNGLYTEITKLCKDSGNDFELVPQIDANGRLYFDANWYEKRGMLKPFTLYEDANIKLSNMPLREQGRIATVCAVWGEGAKWSTKPIGYRKSDEGIAKYGTRWLAMAAQGTDLEANAASLILEHGTPRKTFDITAIDTGDTYYQMRVGDMFPVSFHSVGFSGSGLGTHETIRVLQMSYDEAQNALKIVADQVKE